MQGIYVQSDPSGSYHRPKSKKQIRELIVAGDLHRVYVESTSLFGNEYDGDLNQAPSGTQISFVGPDPFTKRVYYGTITVTADGAKVS